MADYLYVIKVAILVFPILALVFTFPFILNQYHKYGSIQKYRAVIIYSFILYMLTAYFMVILPLPSKASVLELTTSRVRLIPFHFVQFFKMTTSFVWNDPSTYLSALKQPCFYEPAFNFLLTIPFGMYLRYYFRIGFWETLFLSFGLSLFYEVTQLTGLYFIYPRSYRLFDVDDLILNTLGGAFGYLFMGLIKFLPKREKIDALAYERGKEISGFKRITCFILDVFIFSVFTFFLYIFIDNIYIVLISLIIYYILIPCFYNGKTLGSSFLNMKMIVFRFPFIHYTFRIIFVVLYYIGLPLGLFLLLFYLKDALPFSRGEVIYLFIGSFLLLGFQYLIQIIRLFKNKRMFYDRFVGVQFQSTILEKKRDFH